MFRQNNDNDNTATTKRVTEQRTEYRSDNANVAPSSGRAYVVDRNDRNYDNNRSSSYNYNNRTGYNNNNNRDYDDDNRGGWWEGVKENVRDWWHGDENDRDYDNSGRDYNSGRGYHTGQRNYDRDYDRTSYNRNTIGGGYGSDYNRGGDRFNVTARRVDYDTPSSNYRYGGSYGGSYGGPSRNYGGDYDRSYGQGRAYTQNTTSNYDRSYGGGFGGYGPSSYGGGYGGPSYGNRSVAVYGGAGSNDYDRLYGNTRQVQSRRYNNTNNNDMSDLFGDLSLLSDRHETTPNIIEEGGQRMMQWSFDVQGFNLDDIQISDSGSNKIEITGKHEDTGAHHRHAKQFTRIVTLPQNTTAKDVKSRINGRGLLTVTVPYSGKSLNDYNTRELTVGTGGSSSAQRSSGQHSSSQYGSSSNNNQQHGTTGAATTTTTSTSKQQYQSTSNA